MDPIADILREIRKINPDNEWADRIEAAANEIITELNVATAFYRVAIKERDAERSTVDALRVEIARLRAALKPVMEVKWKLWSGSYCSGFVPTVSCDAAVREAHRIFNESEAHS